MTCIARKAIEILKKENISVELIDLRTVKPIDKNLILESVKKTKRVMILDPDFKNVSLSSEIMAIICEEIMDVLIHPPIRITYPDRFVPTSWTLSNHYYPMYHEIVIKALKMFKKNNFFINELKKELEKIKKQDPLDVPDSNFKGPF
jgi:pyruvate dehydrogenase E1 component beta subunit